MLNQDAAPVNEEHLVNRKAPLAKNGRGEDGRQDSEEREREDGRDGRDVGSERGRDANAQNLLSEPGTDGAVRHVRVEEGGGGPNQIAVPSAARYDSGDHKTVEFARRVIGPYEQARI